MINKKNIKNIPKDLRPIKKKREREVYYSPSEDCYYKIWVENWTQGEIVKYCIDSRFYNEENASSFVRLLEGSHGQQRGYVQRRGLIFSSWEDFISKTSLLQRYQFLMSALEESLNVKGVYIDLHPSNLILFESKINFIDLDSFRSHSFVFEKKKAKYEEKIDFDAWWQPYESANRNLTKSYRIYFNKCLKIDACPCIENRKSIDDILKIVRKEYEKI